jgi:hypothetical protein
MREESFIRAGLEVGFAVVDEAAKIVPAVLATIAERGGVDAAHAAMAKL